MIPCLYASTETKFDHNGIGKMADAHSCVVTEKRNGSFELELVYPADGIHAENLEEGNIILAKPSDTGRPQPFRIYKIATPIDGKLTIKARHISYQLNFITVSPFATTGCTGALAALESHAASECPFGVWTDISSSASFRLSVPSSFRNCLGGIDGSVLDTFGGEYEWDRYTVKLHHHRGADHGVHIVYGKNLIDFKMEKNIESVITGVHPYWQNSETGEVTELPEKVVLVEQRSVPYQKITVLDCTSGFQDMPECSVFFYGSSKDGCLQVEGNNQGFSVHNILPQTFTPDESCYYRPGVYTSRDLDFSDYEMHLFVLEGVYTYDSIRGQVEFNDLNDNFTSMSAVRDSLRCKNLIRTVNYSDSNSTTGASVQMIADGECDQTAVKIVGNMGGNLALNSLRCTSLMQLKASKAYTLFVRADEGCPTLTAALGDEVTYGFIQINGASVSVDTVNHHCYCRVS